MKKTALITGGTGFIGSHTCLSLLEQENEVESKNQEALAYTKSQGARELARDQKTYAAQLAKASIEKGDMSTARMHQRASYVEQSEGPQSNPNPLG